MTVYVVQEVPKFNVLPARKYGELELMLPPGQITLSAGPTVNRLKHKLRNFTDMDYLTKNKVHRELVNEGSILLYDTQASLF